jgi:hypothetical protein
MTPPRTPASAAPTNMPIHGESPLSVASTAAV